MKHMGQEEALKVLVEAAIVAQSRGVFSLDDAVVVKQAIDAFKLPSGEGEVAKEDGSEEG